MDGVYDNTDLEKLRSETDCDFIVTPVRPFETLFVPVWKGKHWQVIEVP